MKLNEFSKYLMTGILSVVVALFLFDNINTNKINETGDNQKIRIVANSNQLVEKNNSNKKDISAINKKLPVLITKENIIDESNQSQIQSETKLHDNKNDNFNMIKLSHEKSQIISLTERSNHWTLNRIELPDISNAEFMKNKTEHGFSIGLKGFNSFSYKENKINENEDTYLNEKSISFSYELTDSDIISVEFGQEKFGQTFDKTEDGVVTTISQNPLLFWAGTAYQKNFKNLSFYDNIYSYTRVLAGATRLGPVFKETIGIEYTPDNAVSFRFGIDATQMLYPAFGNLKASSKIAFTYGVFIRY